MSPQNQQGLALQYATQKNQQTHESICDFATAGVEADTGLDAVIAALDAIYICDKAESAYTAYEKFEALRHKDNENISDFVKRFKILQARTSKHGTVMSTDLLAFHLLNSCNLTKTQIQLAGATATTFTLDEVIKALKKILNQTLLNLQLNQNPLITHQIIHLIYRLIIKAATVMHSNSQIIINLKRTTLTQMKFYIHGQDLPLSLPAIQSTI